MEEEKHFDVLIVGAGLSGIGAAWHLQANCPGRSYAILEGRERSGGTWDLFRYPGIRSDSDMYTLGYAFRPWTQAKAIADGPSILNYVRETASDHGIDRKIRFNHRVVRAAWSTPEARWTVDVERGPEREAVRFSCNFLFMCSGYYNYAAGYTPESAGTGDFKGRIVHPQHWPEDLDYTGQRVIVIGSGATAMTLVPEMAKTAAHVTLLQRSPTYVVARPAEDRLANRLRRHLPATWAYGLTRWKNVTLGMLFFRLSRRKPERAKRMILGGVRQALGPDYDIATHFTPRYNPWDQRLCLVPDGDLFAALNAGRASMVTDHIDTFTPGGIRLKSGAELDADLIVTATGLDLQVLGGVELDVDGRRVDPAATFNYKGMMYSDVPNLASSFGYTNASWTLKCDLTCAYVCRVLNHMQKHGWRQCTPRNTDPHLAAEPWIDFSSGYVQRAAGKFPKQGARAPWRLYQNYARDLVMLRFGAVDDGVMEFSNPATRG
ncbi:NAD(P)/FAD-dependent oxidoreductase [Variovorax sp. ZS18.2.2]|uniref:flavin-containing monooxygenase n=1 Tax=Variovorax sp. ZS18.2.2 TaxID=2971255 RepID=UPI002150E550|nr:NAD(P)/FAD-dependent oxidoreductase [Variovorax sp. ZS18.2.2]MCR6475912.1 NAD(P)/FAD-dependent oxidoreductase [Variovorax sp. ZS18.2.2]